MDALIGHTGFVGSNLLRQRQFDALFNSKTIPDSAGRRYGTVVCAAAPATMWQANKFPERDEANIRDLIGHLERLEARSFVLVSTIAVLDSAEAGYDESTTRFETEKAYGRNRRLLEEACAERFEHCHILRLPALFGHDLKKNFIFDMLNPVPAFLTPDKFAELEIHLPDNAAQLLQSVYVWKDDVGMHACDRQVLAKSGAQQALTDALFEIGFTALNFTHQDSTFQFYGLARLADDITRAIENDLPLVHLAPEPVRTGDLYRALTGAALESTGARLYGEDMRTCHGALFGGAGDYIQDRPSVIAALKRFYEEARAA